MRSSIAIAAAIIGAVSAAPEHYGYGGYESVVYSTSTPTPSSTVAPVYTSAPVYPVYSAPVYNSSVEVPYITKTVYTTSLHTVTSCAAYVTDCPAHSTIVYTTVVPAYTTVCPATETEVYPTATPYVPESSSVWVPETSSVYVPESSSVYVPESTSCAESSTVTVVVPVSTPAASATGYIPYPSGGSTAIWGTASSSGYLKPSATYPAEFTGAASHANAGMAVAGLGALAAFFL